MSDQTTPAQRTRIELTVRQLGQPGDAAVIAAAADRLARQLAPAHVDVFDEQGDGLGCYRTDRPDDLPRPWLVFMRDGSHQGELTAEQVDQLVAADMAAPKQTIKAIRRVLGGYRFIRAQWAEARGLDQ